MKTTIVLFLFALCCLVVYAFPPNSDAGIASSANVEKNTPLDDLETNEYRRYGGHYGGHRHYGGGGYGHRHGGYYGNRFGHYGGHRHYGRPYGGYYGGFYG